MIHRRTLHRTLATLTALVVGLAVLAGPSSTGAAGTPSAGVRAVNIEAPLTNLAHLDWLQVQVRPPAQTGHTTYRLTTQPSIDVLWTYADPNGDGTYRHVGGGKYNAATNTWGQGAFNADDMTRAAVVYLRHWKATGSTTSLNSAYGMLRGVTYLQTVSGPNAGNVVLWMQPDGTLNPSADPIELPDPSDSDASYWLARTIWALGEGYAAFSTRDPAFADFLRDRMDLAVAALDRQVLDRYGQHLLIDGARVPAWLVANGADASAEAVLGLAAYVEAGGGRDARTALAQLSEGIAALSGGDSRNWPFGAVLPWALSRSDWHGWGSQMPAALARAAGVLDDSSLARVATKDSAVFDPLMLTSGGPDQARLPTRIDRSQIAYGIDARLQSLLATAEAAGDAQHNLGEQSRSTERSAAQRGAGLRQLAGITAAWSFGANPSGLPAYDPATGRTVDGIAADGTVNHNAGAESTIHGLLSMLALDAFPDVAAIARTASISERVGTMTAQAEDAQLAGSAAVVRPSSLWTGESQYDGIGYVALGDGGSATLTVPPGSSRLVQPVVDLRPGSTAVTTFRSGTLVLGVVRSGDVGAQGDSPAPGALLPVTLAVTLPPDATRVTATTEASGDDTAILDAVMIEPLVSRYVLGGGDHGTAVLRSASRTNRQTTVVLPGTGLARVYAYDGTGRQVDVGSSSARTVPVAIPAGGFTIVRR